MRKKIYIVILFVVILLSLIIFKFNTKDKIDIDSSLNKFLNIDSMGYKNLEELKDVISNKYYTELENNKRILDTYDVEDGIDVTTYVVNILDPWETIDENGNDVEITYSDTLDYKLYKEGDNYYIDTEYLLTDNDTKFEIVKNKGRLDLLVGEHTIGVQLPDYYYIKAKLDLQNKKYEVESSEEIYKQGINSIYAVKVKCIEEIELENFDNSVEKVEDITTLNLLVDVTDGKISNITLNK